MHPVLFFAVVYVVALLLSVFICSTLFYSCNTSSARTGSVQTLEKDLTVPKKAPEPIVALR